MTRHVYRHTLHFILFFICWTKLDWVNYILAHYTWLYVSTVLMMLLCLCWYYEYDVMMLPFLWNFTMIMWFWCRSYHGIFFFHNDIVCVLIVLDEIWYIWCGTWIPTLDVVDLMMLCDEMKGCWWCESNVDWIKIFVRNV